MVVGKIFNKSSHILVIGDVMLDGYANGLVNRISPEAPVPVLNHMHHHEVAGGASNVAMNIVALGGKASLVGLIGDDEEGRRLNSMLTSAGVNTAFVREDGRTTISKLRIVSGNHQLLRIDKEVKENISTETEKMIIDSACKSIMFADAVILSDYMKGCLSDSVLSAVIGAARDRGIPVFVDPKRHNISCYRGVDYITPNRKELTAATGINCSDESSERDAAKKAMESTGAAVLLTRSEDGMVLFAKDGDETWLPTESKEVFDVSGAGDTVVASFALAIAGGIPAEQALRIANCAAGIVIGKLGTATVSADELLRALRKTHTHIVGHESAVSLEEAKRLREEWHREKLIVGFTNGCFDLLHPGHISLLRESAATCDRLIVAINSDSSVKRLKGESRPIQDEASRAIVMSAINDVDLVVIFDEDTPYTVIKELLPDVLIKGGDYQESEIVGGDLVKSAGGMVRRVTIIPGQSTSNLVRRSLTKSGIGGER